MKDITQQTNQVDELNYLRQRVAELEAQLDSYKQISKSQRSNAKKPQESFEWDNQSYLQLALKAANAGIWGWDIETNHVTWSEEYYSLYGLNPEEDDPSYDNWLRCIHPDDRGNAHEAASTAIEQCTNFDSEFRILHPEGIRWIHAIGQVFCGVDGTPIRMAGLAIDITHRKEIEEGLRTSEQRFRRLVDSNIFGVSFGDFASEIYDANDYFLKMVGYTRQELESGQLSWRAMTPAEYLPLDEQAGKELREKGVSTPFRKEYVRRDGTRIPVLIGSALLHEPYDQQNEIVSFYLDLTQLQLTEQRLQLYADAVHHVPMGLLIWQLEQPDSPGSFRLMGANPAASRAVGIDFAELIGQTVADRFPQMLRSPLMKDYLEVLRTGQTKALNDVFYDQDGVAAGVYSIKAFALPNRCLGLSIENVTDRKLTEEALRISRERLDLVLQAAELGVWYCDLPFDRLEWNDRCKEHFGLPPDAEITIDVFYERLHPDDRQRVKDAIDDAILSRTRFDIDYRTITAEGQIRWLRAVGRTFYDKNDVPRRFDGIMIDTTRRKQVENDLRYALQKLNFHVENTPLAVIEWNNQLEVLRWSAAAERIFGWTAQEVLGKQLNQWQFVYEEDLPQLGQVVRRIMSGQEPQIVSRNRNYAKDGRIVYCEWYNSTLTDESGKVSSVLSLVLDTTEHNQLLQREQTAREQAETANRIKDEFLAVLSHELRSPLNPILGWATLLRSRKLNESMVDRALETIERNARLQTQLIDDLLDVSRILRGKLSLNVDRVNLLTIVEAALETIRLSAEAKHIQLCVTVHGQSFSVSDSTEYGGTVPFDSALAPIYVLGDSGRLQQIMWNLLSNAIKFTPNGGQVEVKLEQIEQLEESVLNTPSEQDISLPNPPVHNYAQVRVSDTGKGIQPDFLPHVFEYFRQADSTITRTFGGLGLGLAIVHHLVDLHGGMVWAESPGLGQGATFTVRLPLAKNTLKVGCTNDNSPSEIIAPPNLSGVRILAVDDDPDIRELVQVVLQEAGAEVTVVDSAREALRVLEAAIPDLLISDIGMPQMDGYLLLNRVRSMGNLAQQLPAIALTAYAGEGNRNRALAAGFQLHLSKPFEPAALVAAIADVLQRDKSGV